MTWAPLQGLRRLFDSVSFRLALNYGLLAVFTMLVLIAVFYIQTVGVLKQAHARQVTAAAQRMLHQFERGGRAAIRETVSQMLADGADSDTELYLLLDERGDVIAGNLATVPDIPPGSLRTIERPIDHNGRTARGLLLVTPLPDGSSLIVGSEMSDQRRIESMVQRATLAAATIALLLVFGGTCWFRATLEGRVEAIRRTTLHVGAGDLSSRIPPPGQEDEFARLDRDINQMLDRIEGLMEGVRHVSNTIAHEMRTPMARILAALRTADRPGTSDQQVRQANRVAVQEIESLTTIFDKLLQIAEAESGTRRQAFEPTELDRILRDVIDLFGAVAEEQGTSILDQAGHHLTVLGDRDLLAGAIANLVENALKYTSRGARIRVDASRERDSVVLTVKDNGPGVPASVFDRLGTRFYRLDRSIPGFGLGLASVRAVVQLHGGSLEFADAAPGLSVQIRLPASDS
jgi:signal transduction histidine kinase